MEDYIRPLSDDEQPLLLQSLWKQEKNDMKRFEVRKKSEVGWYYLCRKIKKKLFIQDWLINFSTSSLQISYLVIQFAQVIPDWLTCSQFPTNTVYANMLRSTNWTCIEALVSCIDIICIIFFEASPLLVRFWKKNITAVKFKTGRFDNIDATVIISIVSNAVRK